ncbi:MAG: hypothetical protein N3E48_00970 [Candidatus Bathyarchaeota archaeon]|nr:hypothetical protein [Candidatus Bathyarchaeota archaeon]
MRLERIFGSKMQTRLVEYFLQNHTKVFNQAGLSRFLRCSPSTIARIIEPLVQEGIILYEQISGQMKILALNLESEKVKVLIEFYEKIKKL